MTRLPHADQRDAPYPLEGHSDGTPYPLKGHSDGTPYPLKGHSDGAPYVWMIVLAVLALALLHGSNHLALARPTPVEAASSITPILSPPGGYYDQDVRLEIRRPSPDAQVIFTVDGSVPTLVDGTVYTQPIHLSAATPAVTVVRARVALPRARLGPVVSASYFVGFPFSSKGHSDGTPYLLEGHSDGALATLPMMSLVVDPDDLWDSGRGILANPGQKGDAWERPADVTYVDRDRQSGFQIPAGVRVHGMLSRGFDKKSLRLYFRQEYGASRLEYPLFEESEVQSFKRLVLHSGGEDAYTCPEASWTLLRNQLADSLMHQLGGYATLSRPVLLFINGEPWGITIVRERIDSRLLPDHYGIDSADFIKAPLPAELRSILAGDSDNWDRLVQFVETHDLADPANYAHVESQINVANFIDYNLLQIYAANLDWPLHNVHQFRPRVQGGQWHWLLWDSDRGFGAYPGHVDTNVMQRVLEGDILVGSNRGTLLLRKLLENSAFAEQFISRATDLLNTTLSPESVIGHIDALAAAIEPGIPYEAARWTESADTTDWETSVEELREFARRRPDFVRQHIVKHFDLAGTVGLDLASPATGSGSVAVNGYLLQSLPWQGVFSQNIPVLITAAPAPGYRFAGWEPPVLPQSPVISLTPQASLSITPRFEPLPDNLPHPGDVVFVSYDMGTDSHLRPDRFELLVTRPGGVDLRGWRITDNDTKTATDEGSLIFTDHPAFARVPSGTTVQIVATHTTANLSQDVQKDDLNAWDRLLVLHTGNGHLEATSDPGFNLGPNDNLVLLAPGPSSAFEDDQGIAFVASAGDSCDRPAVSPASFGVLADGIRMDDTCDRPREDREGRPSTCELILAGLAVPCLLLYLSSSRLPRRRGRPRSRRAA